ncbi:hypothetical protein CANARDRAFT_126041 [[Candida] arabinofermentans NRRL YB-2248]|uniref:Potassium transporter n=1 Tax=[Candida] arabinofermentans NRRL YB-2248 TaxID=983967 RepID=A0A1E4SSS0_9ASCO|nr:hypothetical protein CANARDRAFT_126041 [[Candida] arabinofermentans NRRL YB-2248]
MAKKNNKILSTLILCYGSLGAIYGDIGTSPLYVFSTIFKTSPTKMETYGAASCIFWVFTIIVIMKYALIVLVFGPNNNEGGQVAIYSKIARTLKFGPVGVKIPGGKGTIERTHDNDDDDLLTLTRTNTNMSNISSASGRNVSTILKAFLSKFTLGLCFLGCSLVFSDGLLTPTTSVLSAVAGIEVAVPSFGDKVMPVSCAILIVLFISQRFGSGKLTVLFSPIILVWFGILFVNGVISIVKYHPQIFKCMNPYYAVEFLHNGKKIDELAGVMLCVTGCEAMFADISHFGALPIQITLCGIVYPCLMIAYFGQAAYLVEHPDSISNVFYLSIPGGSSTGYFWFVFVFATLATIIASQALILGVFCILKQLIILDCFPRLKMVHTSEKHAGRIFIPVANNVLMVLVVCTTVGFKNSNNVTAAYGLGISVDFIVTTTLIAICLCYVYRMKVIIPIVFFLFFGALDMCLVIAGLKKVPHGAWFSIAVAFLSCSFISFWHWGRTLKVNHDLLNKKTVGEMFVETREFREPVIIDLMNRPKKSEIEEADLSTNLDIAEVNQEDEVASINSEESSPSSVEFVNIRYFGVSKQITRINQVGLMYSSSSTSLANRNFIPELFGHLLNSFGTVPKIFIFIETRVSTHPYIIDPSDTISLQRVDSIPGLYRCIIRSGFMKQTKLTKLLLRELLSSIPETSDLLETFDVDDVLDTLNHFTIPIVHLFEKELVVAKGYPKRNYGSANQVDSDDDDALDEDYEEEHGRFQIYTDYAMLPLRYVRRFLINNVFAPLNGISNNDTMDYLLPESLCSGISDNRNLEVLYLGNRIPL